VKRIIKEHQAVIRDLRDEVEDLEWAIGEIFRRKEAVEAQESHHLDILARHAGFLSPARALPPELISLVFTFLPKGVEFVKAEGINKAFHFGDFEKQDFCFQLRIFKNVTDNGPENHVLRETPLPENERPGLTGN
jgi:hypothetical protein